MSTGPVLALIPARGGSKGLPGKNVRPLLGQSLVARAGAAARESGVVDRVIVSTDDEAIREEALRSGIEAPFVRPVELARDETPMLPVIEHAVGALEREGWSPEIVVLLQPTSPLRTPSHVREAVTRLRESGADSVVGVVELPLHMSPDYVMRIENGELRPFLPGGERLTRRQDARPAYVRDGTVYAFWRSTLARCRSIYGDHCLPLVVPADASITIDTAEDWAAAERMLRERAVR